LFAFSSDRNLCALRAPALPYIWATIQLSFRGTDIAGETGKNDYLEGRRVGRIREATERFGFNPGWTWEINPPLPIPTWAPARRRLWMRQRRHSGKQGNGSTYPYDI
jgi:hypothetical protein